MVLVGYSDSEGSDDESAAVPAPKAATKPAVGSTNFAIDKSNPKKIRVNLTESLSQPLNTQTDGEPPAKRPRVGGGAFSGFNSMLPPPKRDNVPLKPADGSKAPARKVFSLKTGAEPAFSRDSDAELRDLFAESSGQHADAQEDEADTIPAVIPKVAVAEPPRTIATGKPFMFKPLSVSRNGKKKKSASEISPATMALAHPIANSGSQVQPTLHSYANSASLPESIPPKKVSLFSCGPTDARTTDDKPDFTNDEEDDEIIEVLEDDIPHTDVSSTAQASTNQPASLDDVASTLNLSAAERRQLLGRHNGNASKIINFNTDKEYAANQAHIAAGEQIQHNPVRAIASGKHSLKQLISSAQGQKDALEESFAAGRRNRQEAGSKYGW